MAPTESVSKAKHLTRDTEAESHDTLLTYTDVAALTGLKLGTLYGMVHRGEIPHLRLGRRLVRFRATEVHRWLADHTVGAPKEVA